MIITQILSAINSWINYRNTVRELSMLNDRELNDLGISRCDIESVARQVRA